MQGKSSENTASENAPKEVNRRSFSFWATLLLFGMAVIAVVASLPVWRHLYGSSIILDIIQAGSRAGVVGGIADWFAVTALFRHPFGLPIPHTAILPRKKEQLGITLGRFVAGHFFSDKDVAAVLHRFNFARTLAETLDKPENFNSVSQQLRVSIPGLLESLSDGRGASFLARVMDVFVKRKDIAPLLLRASQAIVKNDVHQEVFSFLLSQFRAMVMTKEADLRHFVESRVREQGGRLVGWAIGPSVANQVLQALKLELERIDPMDSQLRQGFTLWVRNELEEIEKDPVRTEQVVRRMRRFFTHESLRLWAGSLWIRLREMVEDDSGKDDGWSAQSFDALLRQMIVALKAQEGLSSKLNQTIETVILGFLPRIRSEIAELIPAVVKKWDGATLSDKLEKGVGQDLAFIRINGTIVGCFIGSILEFVLSLLGNI